MSPNPEKTADFVIFTEEILKEKFHLLCSEDCKSVVFASNNQFKVSQSPCSSQWLLPNTGFFVSYHLFVFLEIILQ